MNIIHKVNPFIVPFMDRLDIRYAAKYLEESSLAFHGHVTLEHFRDSKLIHVQSGENIFTTEGMAKILNVIFHTTAKDTAIYCGIFKNNVTPSLGNTAAACLGASGTYGECQDSDYDPATNRPAYTAAATTTATITNSASKANFTMKASITVYGAFLVSSQAKTATTGTLYCAKAFAASRAVISNDELAVTYSVTCTSS